MDEPRSQRTKVRRRTESTADTGTTTGIEYALNDGIAIGDPAISADETVTATTIDAVSVGGIELRTMHRPGLDKEIERLLQYKLDLGFTQEAALGDKSDTTAMRDETKRSALGAPTGPCQTETWNFSDATLNASGFYGGGMWSWKQSTKTLTLDNITHVTSDNYALWLPPGSTINLQGVSTLGSTYEGLSDTSGIYVRGDLTICGTGALRATGGTAGPDSDSYGISLDSNGALTIAGGATVVAKGGEACDISLGIRVSNLTITNATLVACGDTRAMSLDYTVPHRYPYFVNELTASSSTNLTGDGLTKIVNGKHKWVQIGPAISYNPSRSSSWEFSPTTKSCSGSYRDGVWAWSLDTKTLTLNGMTHVTKAEIALKLSSGVIHLQGANRIVSTGGSGTSKGIDAQGSLTILGDGTLDVEAGMAGQTDQSSSAISVTNKRTLEIRGGATVIASAGQVVRGGESYGAWASNLIISGATLIATGNTRALSSNFVVPSMHSYLTSETTDSTQDSHPGNGKTTIIDHTSRYAQIAPIPPAGPTLESRWDFLTTAICDGSGSYAGGTWSWKHSTKTLTLTNLQYSTSADCGLVLPSDTTLVIQGYNHVSSSSLSAGKNDPSFGIVAMGDLTITGSGTLYCAIDSDTATTSDATGIHLNNKGALRILRGVYVDARGSEVGRGRHYGIFAAGLILNGGSFYAVGARSALSSTCVIPRGYLYCASQTVISPDAVLEEGGSQATIDASHKNASAWPIPVTGPSSERGWNLEPSIYVDGHGEYGRGQWAWKASTKTLTLIRFTHVTKAGLALLLPGDTTIHLKGDNAITAGTLDSGVPAGIIVLGALTITGPGSLTGTSNTATRPPQAGIGIYLFYDDTLTITGGAYVTATGSESDLIFCYGVSASALVIRSGCLISSGGARAISADYIVPRGYKYCAGETTSPSTDEHTGDGETTIIHDIHKYAKIVTCCNPAGTKIPTHHSVDESVEPSQ
ncbi:MAG: hypothetical protein FWD55_05635 [Propionibacteriaceae bacterium]|nr:hypothetical protein [Propionibacteriaceae bacterium]